MKYALVAALLISCAWGQARFTDSLFSKCRVNPESSGLVCSDTVSTARIADPDEQIAIGGRILTIRQYMAEREALAKTLKSITEAPDELAQLRKELEALKKRIALLEIKFDVSAPK
jgi:hypothetical protein